MTGIKSVCTCVAILAEILPWQLPEECPFIAPPIQVFEIPKLPVCRHNSLNNNECWVHIAGRGTLDPAPAQQPGSIQICQPPFPLIYSKITVPFLDTCTDVENIFGRYEGSSPNMLSFIWGLFVYSRGESQHSWFQRKRFRNFQHMIVIESKNLPSNGNIFPLQ